MAARRGRGRAARRKDDDLGRLMIELRTRLKVWVKCSPEDGAMIRMALTQAIERDQAAFDLAPYAETTVRVAAIDAVTYFPPKVPLPPEASPETGSGGEAPR